MTADIKDQTAVAEPLLQALAPRLKQRGLVQSFDRAKVLSRMPTPGSGSDEGCRYEVDLAAKHLAYFINDKQSDWCEVELVATWLGTEGTLLWGWRNPSVPPACAESVRRVAEQHPELGALAKLQLFAVDFDTAWCIADWIGGEAGYLACFPAVKDDATAFLATRIRVGPGLAFTNPANVWCSGCGRTPKQAKHLFAGKHGHICEHCVDVLRVIIDSNREEGRELPPDLDVEEEQPFMPPCMMTGKYVPRLFLPYTAVSYTAAMELIATLDREKPAPMPAG
jgi:hypothetical protein